MRRAGDLHGSTDISATVFDMIAALASIGDRRAISVLRASVRGGPPGGVNGPSSPAK